MRYNIKTIISLAFIGMVLCFITMIIRLENESFSKKTTTTVEKTTIDTEIYANTKDSISSTTYIKTNKNTLNIYSTAT